MLLLMMSSVSRFRLAVSLKLTRTMLSPLTTLCAVMPLDRTSVKAAPQCAAAAGEGPGLGADWPHTQARSALTGVLDNERTAQRLPTFAPRPSGPLAAARHHGAGLGGSPELGSPLAGACFL